MVNLKANAAFKKMGCKWNGYQWESPELAQQEFKALHSQYYDDMIIIEIQHTPLNERIACDSFGNTHARLIAGYVVATASGRDSGARIFEGVAVLKGNFTSGGSSKNFICDYTDDLIIRLKISRNMLSILDKEVAENRFSYKIIETLNKEDLLKTRQSLLNRVQEIDEQLKEIKD